MYARPVIDGQVTTLGVSGMLWRDALVMYDRASKSLWSQVLGEAVAGPAQGAKLVELPSQLTTWGDWVKRHPGTLALVKPKLPNTGYQAYHRDRTAIGVKGTRNPDRRLKGKELVFGMEHGEASAAVPLEHLWREGVMNASVFDRPVVVVSQPEQTSALAWERQVDGRVLTFEAAGGPYLVRDAETGSTWNLEEGLATDGELAGQRLARLEGTAVYWGIWAQYHPETELLGDAGKKRKKK